MKARVIQKIKNEWAKGREEGFQAACHLMAWKCEQDYDYESSGPTYFAVWLNGVVFVLEQYVVNEDLDILLWGMSDEALLNLWEAQLCLKYR